MTITRAASFIADGVSGSRGSVVRATTTTGT